MRHFYKRQNDERMLFLLFDCFKEGDNKKPENDFRKKIQNFDKTKVIFYNPDKKLTFSQEEVKNNPVISLTFSENYNDLVDIIEKNLKDSIIFEYKLCSDLRKCLNRDSNTISDNFFLESGQNLSFYMNSMLDYELFSISELTHMLRIWNKYLTLFIERITKFDEKNCFIIIKTLTNLFQNLSNFFDQR